MKVFKLTLVRHGETSHNRRRLIQGQLETQLNDMGRQQAKLLAKYFDKSGVWFDQVYTSDLSRASETANIIVQGRFDTNHIYFSPLLRERSYGSLEGLPKDVARARADDPSDPFNQAAAAAAAATAPVAAVATAAATTSPTPTASGSSGGGGAGGDGTMEEDWGSNKAQTPSPEDWLGRRASSGDGETLDEVRERVRQFCEEGLFNHVQHNQRVLVVSHGGTIREFMKLFREKYHAQIGHADLVVTPNTAINDFDILLSPPYNDVKYVLPINLHQIPHMIFDVYNRDNPNPVLNFNMTTVEQFSFMLSPYESDQSLTTSSQPSWSSE